MASRRQLLKFFAALGFSTQTFEVFALSGSDRVRRFVAFDAMLYENKPQASELGLEQMPVIYEGRIWRNKETTTALPDLAPLAEDIRLAAAAGNFVIDIERFPLRGDAGLVKDGVSKLVKVIEFCRSMSQGARLGYYGIVPGRDYWRVIKGIGSSKYREWQKENDALLPLVDAVDFLAPSIYTFYPDKAAWRRYAEAQLAESYRLAAGKPVFPFLWPKYHDSNRLLRNTYVHPEFWRDQLDYCAANADGLVIWGGYREEWNPSTSWWRQTAEFLNARRALAGK